MNLGAVLQLRMEFPEDYPSMPPKCMFLEIDGEVLYHPNIYPSYIHLFFLVELDIFFIIFQLRNSGRVCLSILDAEGDWKPVLKVNEVLHGIAHLLDNPNFLKRMS